MMGERERFRYVNEELKYVMRMDNKFKKEFAGISKRLPSLLINNGALLTTAYLLKRAQSSQAERFLIELLIKWLKRIDRLPSNVNLDNLMDELLNMNTEKLALVSDDLLRIAETVKILVAARIGDAE